LPNNNKHIINERRARIAELYLRGWPQYKIAKEVGCSQPQVSHDLKFLSKGWKESALMNIDKIKSQELAKLDHLEREYFDAWERSKNESRDGDPRFLEGVLKCVAKRADIVGLDSPQKSEVNLIPPITGVRIQLDGTDKQSPAEAD